MTATSACTGGTSGDSTDALPALESRACKDFEDGGCELFQRCLRERTSEDWRRFIALYGRRLQAAVGNTLIKHGIRAGDSDCEEMVQDLYVRLLAARELRFEGHSEAQLWAYLMRAITNLVLDARRALSTAKRRVKPAGRDLNAFSSLEDTTMLVSSPEQRCLENELRRIFVARCRQIAGRHGAIRLRVLRMALYEGWTSGEIAERVHGVTPNNVDALVHRLKRLLLQDGIELPHRGRACEPLRQLTSSNDGTCTAAVC